MAQDKRPLITIGICVYNSEDTVARAITGALSQDYDNFELIVVDDGSKDNSPEIIRVAIEGHANARFIQHDQNKTFPGALNTVISNARGDFIAIMDDDDQSMPNRLSVQHKAITDYETKTGASLVACWGSGIRKYPNGYDVNFDAVGSQLNPPIGTEIIDFLLCYGKKDGVFYGSGTPSCSLMTRKSTYEAVGLYDTDMFRSEDGDFSIRLGLSGGHFIGCAERVVMQYSTGGAEKAAQVMHDSYKMLMLKYQDYLESQGTFNYAMTWNKLRLHHFSKQRVKEISTLLTLFMRYPLRTWKHFWSTAPKRIMHEFKMNKKAR